MLKKNIVPILIVVISLLLAIIGFLLIINSTNNTIVTNNTNVTNDTNGTNYTVVDTGQTKCFNNENEIDCNNPNFPNQDASVSGIQFSYSDNSDGTILDNNTNLMWMQSADLNSDGEINIDDKKNQADSARYCEELELAGYSDWRLPNIKTLYSLMNFSGSDTIGDNDTNARPFISTAFFDFGYGDTNADERQIDSQWATSSIYVDQVFGREEAMFGLNLADGRIKGYPTSKLFYIKCVRGNEDYGVNEFVEVTENSIKDKTTGLVWQKDDSRKPTTWSDALQTCSNLEIDGQSDWRLPNAKELHSIVDYSRSPETSNSPAISSIFNSTEITNERGEKDWGFYWTSTTHKKSDESGEGAVYISFGRALGYMNGSWLDVHGSGAQRSDPKNLDLNAISQNNQYQIIDGNIAHGPQGDVVRGENFFRCVRGNSQSYNGESNTPTDSSTNYNHTTISNKSVNDNNIPTQNQPPQEAINACSSKTENESCSFQAPNGTISGSCRSISGDVACVP